MLCSASACLPAALHIYLLPPPVQLYTAQTIKAPSQALLLAVQAIHGRIEVVLEVAVRGGGGGEEEEEAREKSQRRQ